MSFPEFYTPERIGQLYTPNTAAAVDAGRSAGLRVSSGDQRKVFLLLVDVQVDFVHPDGALSVPGAVEDTRRTVEWILRHAGEITTIGASLDSHIPLQIFSPTWWADAQGNHPAPFTAIPSADVKAGRWQPLYEHDWSLQYVDLLEESARKVLMIWPYHTLIGTPGHTLVPALYEAIAYHTSARQSQPMLLSKGSIARTEHYSILEPEVKVPNEPNGDVNRVFLDTLAQYDLVYVAGQAKSHCVLETVASMMRYYPPEIIARLRVLKDAMSSVAHPEIDFDALADETFARFAQNGLRLVDTHTPIG
ncbi:MAG: cysteine hydrolase family protein [Anaerolineae bacterium]